MNMTRILTAFLVSLYLCCTATAFADEASDKILFQDIISNQVAAFNNDDGTKAYSFAAPLVKKYFPTKEIFIAMVKQGYPQVYRAKSLDFGEVFQDNFGRATQRVTLVGPDGKRYEALYAMEKQPDGIWKIAACTVLEIPSVDA
jgi:Domain of unknown function (DUF4864)